MKRRCLSLFFALVFFLLMCVDILGDQLMACLITRKGNVILDNIHYRIGDNFLVPRSCFVTIWGLFLLAAPSRIGVVLTLRLLSWQPCVNVWCWPRDGVFEQILLKQMPCEWFKVEFAITLYQNVSIFSNIKSLFSQVDCCTCRFVSKNKNKVAHSLASVVNIFPVTCPRKIFVLCLFHLLFRQSN